jgi:hypothetical protein
MQQRMYSIRDAKGEIFHAPFYKKTHGEAERDFTSLVNDQQSMPGKFPDDFDLYFVGTWDDTSGKVQTLDTPQHILKAVNVQNR